MTRDEYATLIYYWAGHPQPERIPEILRTLRDSPWAWPLAAHLPTAGVVMALETLYPDRAGQWRRDFPTLYVSLLHAMDTGPSDPQWTEFYVAQWLILRRVSVLDAILNRIADGGEVGLTATVRAQKWASDSVPFRKAFEKAKEARKLAMIIQ